MVQHAAGDIALPVPATRAASAKGVDQAAIPARRDVGETRCALGHRVVQHGGLVNGAVHRAGLHPHDVGNGLAAHLRCGDVSRQSRQRWQRNKYWLGRSVAVDIVHPCGHRAVGVQRRAKHRLAIGQQKAVGLAGKGHLLRAREHRSAGGVVGQLKRAGGPGSPFAGEL